MCDRELGTGVLVCNNSPFKSLCFLRFSKLAKFTTAASKLVEGAEMRVQDLLAGMVREFWVMEVLYLVIWEVTVFLIRFQWMEERPVGTCAG